ncbi:hypothetical protein MPNT_140045 [Candidatus Methylacidithermus pantelleriae]|uniref:Uncharacterized protein n=1 Tax=Candidatus Methylacidithermus pantelleriae TaxID=2744239 RepID=A0A8J2BKK6_9BACT|nr:hypothetical protein MPNT_140045 [Candidatus Methylacidithermus pantelleriae]
MQPRLSPPEASPGEILTHSEATRRGLNRAFCQLKSFLEVRSVNPWPGRRPESALPSRSFLAYRLTPRLRSQSISKGFDGGNFLNPSSLLSYPGKRDFSLKAHLSAECFAKYVKKETNDSKKMALLPLVSRGPKGIEHVGRTKPFIRSATVTYLQTVSKLSENTPD